jgi:hypothetical protein
LETNQEISDLLEIHLNGNKSKKARHDKIRGEQITPFFKLAGLQALYEARGGKVGYDASALGDYSRRNVKDRVELIVKKWTEDLQREITNANAKENKNNKFKLKI